MADGTIFKEALRHTYVFLGPSLALDKARKILPANYLGPVAQGDVAGLLWRRPRTIVIIDGYFNRVPAVWHKEILLALSQGIKVFGAASMGALRAAELYPYGMIGHGRIFEWYKKGLLTADDEVALIHGPEEGGYVNLSLPLVNFRATVAAAVETGWLSAPAAATWIDLARSVYYPERNYPALLAAGKTAGLELSAEFQRFCEAGGVNLKEEDARSLLELVAKSLKRSTPPAPPAFKLAETVYLLDLLGNDLSLQPGAGGRLTPQLLHEYGRLQPGYFERELRAQLMAVVERAAVLLHFEITPAELAAEADNFWRECHLKTPIAMRGWLLANHLHLDHFDELLRRRIYLRRLLGNALNPLPAYYLDVLRERGEFSREIERVGALETAWQVRKNFVNPENLTADDWEKLLLKARQLVNDRDNTLDLGQIARLLGFEGTHELVRQLLKEL